MTRAGNSRGLTAAAGIVAVLLLVACGPRYARRWVQDGPEIKVQLRALGQGDERVERGFDHPLTIAPVRVTHLLSHVDVRKSGEAREGAIPLSLLYPVGEAISAALSRATPDEEVVVQIIRKERRLAIFNSEHLTSLVVYAKGDQLFVHFRHHKWDIPKTRRDDLPEPWVQKRPSSFRVVAGKGMTAVGPQDVAVDWRDPVFRKSDRLRVSRKGEVQRRVILLEGGTEDTDLPDQDVEPSRLDQLTPKTLRKLADLEEARRAGEITEAQYQRRRRALLARNVETR